MSVSPSTKARRVLAALIGIGWRVKRQIGASHRVIGRDGWACDRKICEVTTPTP